MERESEENYLNAVFESKKGKLIKNNDLKSNTHYYENLIDLNISDDSDLFEIENGLRLKNKNQHKEIINMDTENEEIKIINKSAKKEESEILIENNKENIPLESDIEIDSCEISLISSKIHNDESKVIEFGSDLEISDEKNLEFNSPDISIISKSFKNDQNEKNSDFKKTINLNSPKKIESDVEVDFLINEVRGEICKNEIQKQNKIIGNQNNLENQVYEILHNIFKLEDFRENQKEIILESLRQKDIFVLMPTGGGKSLCYQLPALLEDGVTLVVSPLLSLIHDQITNLLNKDIIAMAISSSVRERNIIYESIRKGICKLLYVTPEMLVKNLHFRDFLKSINVSRFVIDEAHCMSQWGNDFRPDYKELGFLKTEFKKPIICLTATATERVEKDILKIMENPIVYRMSFNRRNLKYYVKPKGRDADLDIVSFINTFYPDSLGIIYCFSKRDSESLSERLNEKYGMKSAFYHAGLSKNERKNIQNLWGKEFKIITATIAFGMGIDRKDVRFVIHYSLPKSLEGYYQETGRAGRDNLESVCVLFYNYGDKKKINFLIDKGRDKLRQREELEYVVRYCENNTECRRKQILRYFGEDINFCDGCDVCEKQTVKSENKDFTHHAKNLQQLISHISKKITLTQRVDIYRGSNNKKSKIFKNVIYFGRGKDEKKTDLENLIKKMIMEGYLKEKIEKVGAYKWNYLVSGKAIKTRICI